MTATPYGSKWVQIPDRRLKEREKIDLEDASAITSQKRILEGKR